MTALIVVFGAAVRADGRPSAALARRIAAAEWAARDDPASTVFCSGAIGRHPPSEAAVMAAALTPVIGRERIHLDEESRDTLQTVAAAVAYARNHGQDWIVACSDRYHLPRIAMLFRLFGIRCVFAPAVGRGPARMRWREAAALPYDLIAGLWAVTRSARRPR
ncbi:YdcF family protein [Sphingomonas sp. RS2018]